MSIATDARPTFVDSLLEESLHALATLDHASDDERHYDASWQTVDEVGGLLAALAGNDTCPRPLSVVLLDCRDRLASHLLAADQLTEAGDDRASRVRVLQRGVRRLIGELSAAEDLDAPVTAAH